MTPHEATTLLDYHYWALQRVLQAVDALSDDQYRRDLGNSFTSIRDTLVHAYSAEWIWHCRWTGMSPSGMIDPASHSDRLSLRQAWSEHEAKMRTVVGGLDQSALDRVHQYRLMNGDPGETVFWQMLQHVVNHASYHRGQVTTMLRQLGASPPASQDLIRFYRERSSPNP
jgi:uncharacterized damage-inducible protein DinB